MYDLALLREDEPFGEWVKFVLEISSQLHQILKVVD
jgi:hypothetical protein